MDSTVIKDLVFRFVSEAFKQSPLNGSNGYEFAMGTVATLLVLFLGAIGILYRDGKRERRLEKTERKQARIEATNQINKRFDDLQRKIDADLDEIEKEIKLDLGNIQSEHASYGNRLAGIDVEIQYLKTKR